MGKKKRHHYVSDFYLRGFADPTQNINDKRFVWVYEKGSQEIRKASTRDVGIIKHFHTIITLEGERDTETLENLFQVIESKAAPTLRKIVEKRDFGEQDREWLAKFIGVMYLRTPNWRQVIERHVDAESEKPGFHNGSEPYDLDVQKTWLFGEMAIDSSNILTRKLLTMPWTFVESDTGLLFVTSDNPVFCCNSKRRSPPTYRLDITSEDFEVTFPLTQTLTFFACTRMRTGSYRSVRAQAVREINRQTVIAASKYVFAPFRDDHFQAHSFVQKYINTAPRL